MTDLRAQLQSTLGNDYTIERELGGGGMSRVFLAQEHALKRKVVIKVLPNEATGALSVERFKREIQFAATLQQANIVPVLNAGETNGVPFYTMPYVEGESLRARLAVNGKFEVPEAIGLLKEIARALSHAHGKHVVHRDIKPDNVLLSGGSAMVTDFGIAKALSDSTTAGGRTLTGTGTSLGTPAYMSPEQATGDSNIDHRADIYAFGCLAYEMLTGAPPFAGPTLQSVIAAHLTKEPEPIERRREKLPKTLVSLVTRCLAKDPGARPQSAIELVYALDELSAPTPTNIPMSAARIRRGPVVAAAVFIVVTIFVGGALLTLPLLKGGRSAGPMSVAVLPFNNKLRDTSLAYLAEGLSDELRSMLTAVQGLSVKARSSSMQLAGKGAREAGSKLKVDAILEGTLTGSAAQPRVVAELVRASDETSLWSGTIDLPSTGLAQFRDSLTRSIAAALHAPGSATTQLAAAADRGTNNDEAYQEYLKGEYARRRFNYAAALPHLQKAIALDSNFARAHGSLAVTYGMRPAVGATYDADMVTQVTVSATRALTLSPTLPTAQLALGLLPIFRDHDAVESERIIRRAVESNPNDSEARFWYAWALGAQGRTAEAMVQTDSGLQRDPLSPDLLVMRQVGLLITHRYEQALVASRAVLEVDPSNLPGIWNHAELHAFAGHPDSAVAWGETLFRIDSVSFSARSILMMMYAAAGRWDDARIQRRKAAATAGNSPNYVRLMGALAFGEIEVAAEAFERGIRTREPAFNTLWPNCEPFFDPIKKHAKYLATLKSIKSTSCPPGPKWPIGPAPKQ